MSAVKAPRPPEVTHPATAVVYLVLAAMGAAMLGVAYLRWVDHTATLWMLLP